jgi:8-oxo-dGTP pyrophosphatase MutT (NUDIX family)
MEKKSCGAIFYAYDPNGNLGIILGSEMTDLWLPFKGGCMENETEEETAIREIYEETCGLVKIDSITLYHKFSTKRKMYHIGICEVPFDIVEKFDKIRNDETRVEYLEKKELVFLPYPEVLKNPLVHNISRASILFYKNFLDNLKNNKKNTRQVIGLRSRYVGISKTAVHKQHLARPKKINISYTPEEDRLLDSTKIWRREEQPLIVA